MEQDKIISIPQPSMCLHWDKNSVRVGENVVVTFIQEGKQKILGTLIDFNSEKSRLVVHSKDSNGNQTYSLDEIKVMTIPQPRLWQLDKVTDVGGHNAVSTSDPQKSFEINFVDGQDLNGDTLGFRVDRNGIYLFPKQSSSEYIYVFASHKAIKKYHIGPRLGEVLLDQEVVDKEQLESALIKQSNSRNMPLGEILRSKAICSELELEHALEKQKSSPNLRLGEILISENLISEQQLNEALDSQTKDRSKPLGEILIDTGLVDTTQIQSSLAKKLGIPFIDLNKFEISPDVVSLLPEELVREHKILPLYTYQ